MNISEALRIAEEGKMVRRDFWGHGIVLRSVLESGTGDRIIEIGSDSNGFEPYTSSYEDGIANDWKEVS